MLRFASLLLVTGLVACSSKESPSSPDASAPSTATALSTLRTFDAFRDHLGSAGALQRDDAGFRLVRRAGFRALDALEATLPARADQALRIEGGPGFFVEVRTEGDRPVEGAVEGSAITYPEAAPGVDVVHVVEGDRVEDIRVIKSSTARLHVRMSLSLGPAVASARVLEGRVELLDSRGEVRLATRPIFAVDARGTRRDATVTLSGAGTARTLDLDVDASGLIAPIALDPEWRLMSATVSSSWSRVELVPLPDGKLITFGSGAGASSGTPKAWTFDPTVMSISSAPDTAYSKTAYSAVTLSSGKILLYGNGTLAELYTVGSGGTATGATTAARSSPALTRVTSPSERVYAIGGYSGSTWQTANEMYDVATGNWVAKAPLASPRGQHTQTLVAGNLILVAGGNSGSANLNTAFLYDVVGDTYIATTGNMVVGRYDHTATLLDDGRVLLTGGRKTGSTIVEAVEIYRPSSKDFVTAPPMAYARADHRAIKLQSGKVLVVGGYGHISTGAPDSYLASTEIFDPSTDTWSAGPDLNVPRRFFGLGPASGDRVVVALGETTGGLTAKTWEQFIPTAAGCTTSGPGCANCVDGYCCDSPCTAQCQACDVAGFLGICTNVIGEAPHGTRTACSPFLQCGTNGTCAVACAGDSACAAGSYCGGSACYPKKANGIACGADNECTSGSCATGMCCNTACTGQCDSCNLAGKAGTCSPVTGQPEAGKPACSLGFACVSGACATTCTADFQCATSSYCSGGACLTKKIQGTACTTASECLTGNCVDGFCCNLPCAGACQACNLVGAEGKCSNVPAGSPRGTRTCTPSIYCGPAGACSSSCTSHADCATGFVCLSGTCTTKKVNGSSCLDALECASGNCVNGTCCDTPCFGECESCRLTGAIGTCKLKPATSSCGANGCSGAYLVTTGTCSGTSNTCVPSSLTACPGSLICADATSCKTSCTSNADCTTGVCITSTGKCGAAPVDAGPPGDSGIPIADAPAPTIPSKPVLTGDFTRCSKDGDCSTGHCVEGVCCNTECADRCHSCALLSNPGQCTQEPIGVDLKNECGPALSCLGTCGGEGQCIGAGAGTMCARNRCVGASTGVGPAYCSEPGGKCPAGDVVPFDCSPYVCEPAFGACRGSCGSSNDCANGFVCDIPNKVCIAAPSIATGDGTTEDAGGCGCTTPGRAPSGAWLAAALGLGISVLRRRRSR